jgi:putative ABC transport system ATP-binding protein
MRNLVLLDPWQRGQVYFRGKPLTDWFLPHYRSQVVYLPQRAVALAGTVRENLEQVFQLSRHRHQRFSPDRIEAWLGELGRSSQFLSLKGTELSGGETQILALLRALQLEPQILLLDEPTASLDAETAHRVEQLLQRWLAQSGKACLLTSHDPAQRQRLTHTQISLETKTNG